MFSCSACLRRTVATLIQDAPLETFTRPGILSKTQLAKQQTAHHSTIQSIRKGHHVRVLRKALNENRDIRPSRRESVRGPSKVTRRDALARERNRHHLDVEPAAGAEPHGSKLHHRRSDEEYQIQFLTDPLKLATTVLARLRLNDIQGALSLVRLSDKEKVENIVSWNHLMDYEMNFKNVKAAMKIYNEVRIYHRLTSSCLICYTSPHCSSVTEFFCNLDEETRPQTRRTYLHHHATWLHI